MRKEGQVEKNCPVKSEQDRGKWDGEKLCSVGNLKHQGQKKQFVKVSYFQELSEDAKVLVDAYGENPPVKNALLQNSISLR